MKISIASVFVLIVLAQVTTWCADTLGHGIDNGVLRNLTIEQAVQIALKDHPHLAEAMANIASSKARAEVAGRLPNPDLVARMESAPLSSRATSEAEYIAGVSQAIPLGRRLSAARQVEEAQLAARQKEYETAALELARKVRNAFATALYTSDVLNAQTNLSVNIQELVRITGARVEQGDATGADLARVQAEEAEQRLITTEASAAHHAALDALAAAMGNFRTRIDSLHGNLEESLRMVEIKQATFALHSHPAVEAMQEAVASQRARVRLSEAERIPDVNLDLFYRRLQGTRENAFDVGVSVPIPIFDNGRRRVREAESQLRAAEARLDKARNDIGHEMHVRELALQRAIQTASALKDDIIPKVELSLRATEARYAAGDISLTELLVVRREANATRLRYLATITEVLENWAGIASGNRN